MEPLIIDSTNLTPEIKFDAAKGIFEMKGRSIPENSLEFYQPVYEWLDSYLDSPNDKTILKVQFDYFNTSSSKCILDILKRIDKLEDMDKDILIKWYYDENDEDMMEAGEDYSDLLESPFELITIE
jgi:hypothetical protein